MGGVLLLFLFYYYLVLTPRENDLVIVIQGRQGQAAILTSLERGALAITRAVVVSFEGCVFIWGELHWRNDGRELAAFLVARGRQEHLTGSGLPKLEWSVRVELDCVLRVDISEAEVTLQAMRAPDYEGLHLLRSFGHLSNAEAADIVLAAVGH